MTAETWQPGDILPGHEELGQVYHALVEDFNDHRCLEGEECDWFPVWDDEDWADMTQLGPHDDTLPPLPWLHGTAS